MTSEVRQLIDQTIALTGAQPPGMLDADAPVLAPSSALAMYLIGLVGGKDVGKSSLVNALAGQQIAAPTSSGPGTETAIAYAHESARDALKQLLDAQVPGRHSIVTHSINHLTRQVLVDLPDIDSRWGEHLQITRRMLRHMLYPLWIQSVEKYADRQPQELLAAVAEGNDPTNFIFCLNKADQLSNSAAEELRDDFSERIARTLKLGSKPRVFLISAANPDRFDLPELRELLSRQRTDETVKRSLSLAEKRQDRSLFGWIERQRLSERAEQLARLESDAEEMTASRIALPILDQAIPRLLDDPGQRMAMLAPAVRLRMSRWPIINAIDALLSPLLALVQKNLSTSPTGSTDPDAYLPGGGVSEQVQAAFAQLQQLHPELSDLYRDGKLWESMHADLSAIELRRRFAATSERQKQQILDQAAGRFPALFAPVRWLLTIGAILWFPIVQPILSALLAQDTWEFTKKTLEVVVNVLSVAHLLECTTFLLLWLLILWAILRYSTQRMVNRIVEKWKLAGGEDELSLAGQTMQWIDELLEPIRNRRRQMEEIVQRAEQLRAQLSVATPAEARAALARNPA